MINLSCEISDDTMHDVTSELGKYPVSCLYKHNKMAAEFNELYLALTS